MSRVGFEDEVCIHHVPNLHPAPSFGHSMILVKDVRRPFSVILTRQSRFFPAVLLPRSRWF